VNRDEFSISSSRVSFPSQLTNQDQPDEQVSDTLVGSFGRHVSDGKDVQVDVSGSRTGGTAYDEDEKMSERVSSSWDAAGTHVTGIKMIQVKRK
jgi:hypothetical protein